MLKKRIAKDSVKKRSGDVSKHPVENNSEQFEQDFYSDLDTSRKKSCCSLPFIVILLFSIFVIMVVILLWLKNSTHIGLGFVADKYNQDYTLVTDSLVDKANNLASGQTSNLEFSEKEVAAYLGLSDEDFPLKNAKLSINPDGVHLSGRTSKSVFSLPVSVIIMPHLEQDKIILSVDNVSTGSISLPQRIRGSMDEYLDLIMRSRPIGNDQLDIQSVTCETQKIIVAIQKK